MSERKGISIMKNVKKIGIGIGIIVCIAIIGCINWLWNDWTIRYKSQLNNFFGKGNWEVVSDEMKYNRRHITKKGLLGESGGRERIGLYREWNILCANENGEEEIWEISTGVYVANHERYSFWNPKRYKAKQALTLELMDLSFVVVEEEVRDEMIKEGLTEEEADCFNIHMSYHGGNPKPSFYSKLAKQSWFTMDGVSAANYLNSDLYDFYLGIRIYDYEFEALSEQEQENVRNYLENMEESLLEKYGDNVSFEIHYEDYKVEYVDGVKQ